MSPPLPWQFATAGGHQKLQCWNTEGIFRLIQSIPSPKVEPLKKDAKDGGAVAGRTRKDIEQQTGKPVISTKNFKQLASVVPKKLKKSDD